MMSMIDSEIPKVIHYCWFGGAELPDSAKKYINSWKKYFPNYELKRWDESNFDCACCEYVKEAYKEKKYAFVSDYARFWILYNYGGIYFDTDVEVIKSFDDIVESGSFMGCELAGQFETGINPGLGLGAPPGLSLYKFILDFYETIRYLDRDEDKNKVTVVDIITNIFKKEGFRGNGEMERIMGVLVYPQDYFCPLDYITGELKLTKNTRSIHHYTASWLSVRERQWNKLEQKLANRYGVNRTLSIYNNYIWVTVRMLYCQGFIKTWKRICKRLKRLFSSNIMKH